MTISPASHPHENFQSLLVNQFGQKPPEFFRVEVFFSFPRNPAFVSQQFTTATIVNFSTKHRQNLHFPDPIITLNSILPFSHSYQAINYHHATMAPKRDREEDEHPVVAREGAGIEAPTGGHLVTIEALMQKIDVLKEKLEDMEDKRDDAILQWSKRNGEMHIMLREKDKKMEEKLAEKAKEAEETMKNYKLSVQRTTREGWDKYREEQKKVENLTKLVKQQAEVQRNLLAQQQAQTQPQNTGNNNKAAEIKGLEKDLAEKSTQLTVEQRIVATLKARIAQLENPSGAAITLTPAPAAVQPQDSHEVTHVPKGQLEAARKLFRTRINEKEAELKKVQEKLEDLEYRLDEQENTLEEHKECEEIIDELHGTIDVRDRTIQELNTNIQELKTTVKKETTAAQLDRHRLTGARSIHDGQINDLKSKITDLTTRLCFETAAKNQLQAQSNGLQNTTLQVEEYEDEIKRLEAQVTGLTSKLSLAKDENTQLDQKLTKLDVDTTETEEKLKAEIETLKRQITQLASTEKTAGDQATNQNTALNAQVTSLTAQVTDLTAQVTGLTSKLCFAEGENTKLDQQVKTLVATTTQTENDLNLQVENLKRKINQLKSADQTAGNQATQQNIALTAQVTSLTEQVTALNNQVVAQTTELAKEKEAKQKLEQKVKQKVQDFKRAALQQIQTAQNSSSQYQEQVTQLKQIIVSYEAQAKAHVCTPAQETPPAPTTPAPTTSTVGGWNDWDVPVVKLTDLFADWHLKLDEEENSRRIIAVKDQHAPAQRAPAQERSSAPIITVTDQNAPARHAPAQEQSSTPITPVTDHRASARHAPAPATTAHSFARSGISIVTSFSDSSTTSSSSPTSAIGSSASKSATTPASSPATSPTDPSPPPPTPYDAREDVPDIESWWFDPTTFNRTWEPETFEYRRCRPYCDNCRTRGALRLVDNQWTLPADFGRKIPCAEHSKWWYPPTEKACFQKPLWNPQCQDCIEGDARASGEEDKLPEELKEQLACRDHSCQWAVHDLVEQRARFVLYEQSRKKEEAAAAWRLHEEKLAHYRAIYGRYWPASKGDGKGVAQ
ncbi:hypothetical protein CONLIGDRAFT_299623 [Coniochaeta ligniaria NRRL 30616]|uniref:Uncharacterized protein n=1 Tax=Coniochaeta ligniaria NRRL 30616 TaxID=1408157 RepID=A0A1J7JCN5_9PEZI|nr:hypothetical protein CONLIGDRAFT_299623 [Coniochaeta ligniaria NRRL 30616]